MRVSGLSLVFAGSPEAAVPSLRALVASDHRVLGVITREDSPQGRKRVLTATPVAAEAERSGVPVVRANRLDARVEAEVERFAPDLGVIVAYGGLVREPLLSMPKLGWINLHFSLLPRWRGAAPVQRAIIAGDDITGASVFQLVPELDAGDVFGQMTQPIGAHETAGHLLESLSYAGAELLVRVVDSIAAGGAVARPQEGDVSFAPKLSLAEGRIDFAADAVTVLNQVLGVTPEPGAFMTLDGVRVKIHDATLARDAAPLPAGQVESQAGRILVGTASHPLELLTVQPAGRRSMAAADWWRGHSGSSQAELQ